MPQFEIAPRTGPTTFVRARSAEDAVRRHLTDAPDPDLGTPEDGTGWQTVSVGGADWGRIRTRDRMKFRRD